MNVFAAYTQRAPNRVFVSVVLGAVAGVAYSMLIPLVLGVLKSTDPRFEPITSQSAIVLGFEVSNYPLALLFASVCLIILVCRTLSQILLTRVAMDVTSSLRIDMYDRIAQAPVQVIERLGAPRLIAALTTDVPRIVSGARVFPDLLMNSVTLSGMLGFLLYLNASVFWFVISAIAVGAITYQIPMVIGRRYIMRARQHVDALQEGVRGLIHGVKELKLDALKRRDYFDHCLAAEEREVRTADKTGQSIMRGTMNYGNLLVFFVLGAVAFVFVNYHAVSNTELVGIVMALLYVSGPVTMLLNVVPQVARARVSVTKVRKLFEEMAIEPAAVNGRAARRWDTMRFRGVSFSYDEELSEHPFRLGPIDFEIQRGQITFIVGGNGSGKSTLSKLITLHYEPQDGAIEFDGEGLDAANIIGYRSQVAAIYSDYYLFKRLLGVSGDEAESKLREYLNMLELDNKVSFKDGEFSTLALSDGQKRRLALAVAVVEDKELYLFDEWAADQDPTFKQVFYRRILPELRACGKAVVVISHDDRYFDVADRLIVMEDGRIVRIEARGGTCSQATAQTGRLAGVTE